MQEVSSTENFVNILPESFKRISWGAIFAGVVVVLATQMFLDLIGLSIGAGMVHPMKQANPLQGVGVGAVIWFAVSMILSVFAGGWVAGRLSGVNRVLETTLHGIITWGLASLVGAFMVTSAAGAVFSGVTGLIGRSISMASRVAEDVGGETVNQGSIALEDSGTASNLRAQALALLHPNGANATSGMGPEAVPSDAMGNSQGDDFDQPVGDQVAAGVPVDNLAVSTLVDRFFNRTDNQPMSSTDKASAVSVLVMRGNVNPTDAQRMVDKWDQMYLQSRAKVADVKVQAEEKAREAGKLAAIAVARTAAWSAIIMALGALAGAFGGFEAVSADVRHSMLHRRSVIHPANAQI